MPLPMILMSVVLLGWPLVQIASVMLVRGRRTRIRALAAELRAAPGYRSSDFAMLDRSLAESRGDAASVMAPVALPLTILAAALAQLFGRERPSLRTMDPEVVSSGLDEIRMELGTRMGDETIDHDPRFHQIEELVFEVGFMRRPVTSLMTIATCLPVLPIYLLAYGVRETMAVVPRATLALVRGIRFATLDIQGAHGR